MGTTGYNQLAEAGYVIRQASWLPIKPKYSGPPHLRLNKPIHHATRDYTIYASIALIEYLHTKGSAVDPATPLQAICNFADSFP